MVKVTVEIEGTEARLQSASTGSTPAALTAVAPSAGDVPAALATKAAASGANNAGPAPALNAVQPGAPIAASRFASAGDAAVSEATSAGAAPAHLFGGQP